MQNGMTLDSVTGPLRLRPLYMERVWGGRELETLYRRKLPEGSGPIGESWEVVDREDEQSVAEDGPLAGATLHELWQKHRREIFGETAPDAPRFPLLVKILDARDRLSIQVHPPAGVAEKLHGEPKTEMWYIAKADADAALYIGVKPGVDREAFAAAIQNGTVEDAVHRITVKSGDFIFVPSGRLHAIGAGLVIFEIQQNSDTTYRVFDWNRMGLDGKPRKLHVEESLQCIDFTDTAPALGMADGSVLVSCPHFIVERVQLGPGSSMKWGRVGEFSILTVVEGAVTFEGLPLRSGDFVLVPASLDAWQRGLRTDDGAVLVKTGFGARVSS
jgi:mannose-6-phosphate isomerase